MTDSTVAAPDAAKTEAFANRMIDVLNSGGLAMMLSIGHRTGLFDSMAGQSPATSQDIAEAANLNERYVREWLGAMVTGGVVDYDVAAKTYVLPPEHAALLTRSSSDSIASTMQWLAVLGGVEDKIVDCFHNGGGVHYSAFNRFHEVMAEDSAQTVVAALEDHIIPLAPDLINRLQDGIDVLDVGCGSGFALCRLAELFPNSRFVGFDLCDDAIERGRELIAERSLKNVRLDVRDVTKIGESATFDLITAFDAIHDQAKPAQVLSEIATALKPGGIFLMQDIHTSSHVHKNVDHPIGTFLYTISTMHCMTVSLAQDGAGLGTCWGEELALKMLDDAGFDNVVVERLPHDMMNSYYIARKT